MSSETDDAHAADGMNSQGENVAGWNPSAVNDSKKQSKKHLSESLSAVLDEMGDATARRRATLLWLARKR